MHIPDDDVYVAESYREASGVYALVCLKYDHEMMAGMIRKVKIQSSDTYDLCSDICV